MGREVEELAQHNEVHLLTFANSSEEKKLANEHAGYIETVRSNAFIMGLRCLLHPTLPFLFSARTSLSFAIKLIRAVKKYRIEAIHAEYTAMGQYVWVKCLFPNITFTLVEHDVVLQSYERKEMRTHGLGKLFARWQLGRVRAKEKSYCERADNVLVLSDKDASLIRKYYPNTCEPVVINPYCGVDVDNAKTGKREKDARICFVGQMSRPENNEAAMRLIRLYRQNGLDSLAKLVIIGANPSQEVLAECSDNIIATGFVDDIAEEISKCTIAVFPLSAGAGVKVKILQAGSLGLPVITTAVGAEGIDEDGCALIVSEDDTEMAEEAKKLLADHSAWENKSTSIQEWMKTHFSWDKTQGIFKQLYR